MVEGHAIAGERPKGDASSYDQSETMVPA
jgi:hypothetical protein